MSALTDEERDRDYQVQLLLLAQQNKSMGVDDGAISHVQHASETLSGRIGNLIEASDLVCETCLGDLVHQDPDLLEDLQTQVHRTAGSDVKTGPDLHQCLCGYFSQSEAELGAHFETNPSAKTVLDDLGGRLEAVKIHNPCREKLQRTLQSWEIGKR